MKDAMSQRELTDRHRENAAWALGTMLTGKGILC